MTKEELDPRIQDALAPLKDIPPRDPRRAAAGRAAFLAEAQRLAERRPTPPQAVSFGLWARLKSWIRRSIGAQPTKRKEGFAMPGLVIAVIAALSLIFGGGALTVQAADAAAPGDWLYPVDLAVENLQLSLTSSPEKQAQLRLAFAQERMQEVQVLLQQGKTDQVDVALLNMETHLATAAQLAAQAALEGQATTAKQVEEEIVRQAEALQSVLAEAPEPAKEALEHALQVSTMVHEQVRSAESGSGGTDTFHLQGIVEAVGDGTVTVNGVTVQVAPGTVMPQGMVQVGASVEITGLVDPTNGAWVALKITQAESEKQGDKSQAKLSFEGAVESVTQGEIVVGGQVVRLTDQTNIKGDVQVGLIVEVRAYLDPDGNLVAEKVEVKGADAKEGTPGFETKFSGVVSSMDLGQIVVDGQTIALTADTKVEGNLQVGSMVEVKAYLGADGTYVAKKVEVKSTAGQGAPGSEMKFSGVVSSVDAGQIVVDGQTIALTADTKVEGNLQVGSMVEVKAYLGADGTYVAKKVEVKSTAGQGAPGSEMKFSGVVSSADAGQIVVNGQTITITADTKVEGNLQVGSTVEVQAYLGADGTYVAKKVEVKSAPGQGTPGSEMKFSGVVSNMDLGQIEIDGLTITLTAETKVEGNLQIGSTVEVEAYLGADGTYVAKKVEVKKASTNNGTTSVGTSTPTPTPSGKTGESGEHDDDGGGEHDDDH